MSLLNFAHDPGYKDNYKPTLISEYEKYSSNNSTVGPFRSCMEKILSVSGKLFSTIMSGITSILPSRNYTKTKCTEAHEYLKKLGITGKTDKKYNTLRGFANYFDNYCGNESNSVSFKQALQLANEGRDLFQKIQKDQANKPESFKQAQKDMSKLIWFFTYCSVAQGKEFTSGTFCLKDIKVLKHFEVDPGEKKHLYPRASSHYPGRVKGGNFGINIERDATQALPYNKRTVLLGSIDIPGQAKTGLYIKMERSGCNMNIFSDHRALELNSLKQTIHHAISFNPLKRVLKAVGFKFKEKDNLPKQKEHVPPEIKNAFKEMVDENRIKYDREKLKSYGISHINEIFNANKEKLPEQSETVQKVQEILEQYGDSASSRKGEEVFIKSKAPLDNQESNILKNAVTSVASNA